MGGDRFKSFDGKKRMRWVSILGAISRVSAVRLQVKYGLHPLATEDLLNLDRQKPKVGVRTTATSWQPCLLWWLNLPVVVVAPLQGITTEVQTATQHPTFKNYSCIVCMHRFIVFARSGRWTATNITTS